MKKFILPGKTQDITVEQLSQFIDDFNNHKLTPFLKSQDPQPKEGSVYVVVGRDFQEQVIDNDDDVLMEFYAPWCGHCKKLAPVWSQVAEELSSVPGLRIAKMDSTANEVESVEIRGYPTLKFYARGQKGSPKEYEGDREVEGIKAYLREHSTAYKTYLEAKTDL